MCGIVAAVTDSRVVPVPVQVLKKLQHRGYDSADMAVIGKEVIERARSVEHKLNELKRNKISSVFHHVPQYSSRAGQQYGRGCGSLELADHQPECLVRLPLWVGLPSESQERIVGQSAGSLAMAN